MERLLAGLIRKAGLAYPQLYAKWQGGGIGRRNGQ